MPWIRTIPSKMVFVEVLGILQTDPDIGANVEPECFRIDDQPAAEDHPRLVELADALVDGRARNAALACDFEERHPRILDKEFEDLSIDRIQVHF